MGGLPGQGCGQGPYDGLRRSATPEEDQGARLNAGRFDALKIVHTFNRLGIQYVVIGGYAGELHAAAVPPTRDIDFTPRVTQENLGQLSRMRLRPRPERDRADRGTAGLGLRRRTGCPPSRS